MGQGDLTVKGDLAVEGNIAVDGDGISAIGDVMMFSGTWTDNVTKLGWYACIAANVVHGCPDLVDKFVFGGSASGAEGGSNTMTDHIHSTGVQNANHTHTGGAHTHNIRSYGTGSVQVRIQHNMAPADYVTHSGAALSSAIGALTDQTADHGHVVGTGVVPGSTNSRPAYYTLIFIRKCYN